MTIRQALKELGMYMEPSRGRPALYSREDLKLVKAQQSRSARARAAADRAAKKAGEAVPNRKRGRPKLYNTPEEAKVAQREQNRICAERYKARMIGALCALKDTLEPTREIEPSPTERNIILPI